MSLLTDSFETFTVMNKTATQDSYGSVTEIYTEGINIQGAMPFDNSTLVKIAQAAGAKSTYTLTVRKNVELDFPTVLKRKRDDKYFRLTSGTEDHQTPPSAALNMRQYTVEEFTMKKGAVASGQTTSP